MLVLEHDANLLKKSCAYARIQYSSWLWTIILLHMSVLLELQNCRLIL